MTNTNTQPEEPGHTGGHTPGPWKLGERRGDYVAIDAPSHTGLADVVWHMEDDRICGDPSPCQQANARLIAAAPDLLKALTDVLNTSGARAEYHAFKYADAIERAEAAIARATQPEAGSE
ncbi:MAG: hypothetical protein EON59_06780 [Alphaproteobacteria bacterium]|nr:MAG: hypothetical protein EON59_06780 [Alphaproteobacteria bacterium]